MGSSAKSSSDSVKVAVRVRPLNDREKSLKASSSGVSWNLTPTSITQMVNKRPTAANSFAFDHVFLENINNESVYNAIAKNLVESTVEGLNGVIFAYGQTAAGKTHTMLGSDSDPGITRRSIMDLFACIAATQGRGFLLRASYIEIYNEEIKDLLGGADSGNLKIHEDVVNKRVYVNSKEEVVTSIQDVMDMIAAGEHTRAVGVTNMNDRSSRSHTIFTLKVESRELNTGNPSDEDDDDGGDGVAVRASTLTLVDLAGSERAAHTKAEGQRLKEGGHINKSLLTLGTVINKLSSGETAAHIPYRDSKLTRILQPALGGNARTAILCAVTPSLVHMDETLSTLRFASRAKKVTNHAHRNEFLDDRAKLKRALKEISSLKSMMSVLKASGIRSSSSDGGGSGTLPAKNETKKRIEFFTSKFEKLLAISTTQDPATRGTKRPSESNIEPVAKVAKLDARASVDSRGTRSVAVNLPDTWDKIGKLREALDLCGDRSGGSLFSMGSKSREETDKAEADFRMRALNAEKKLKEELSLIECERTAMDAEVAQLQTIAGNAEKAQEAAQIEWTSAVSTLKCAQARSIVDEIITGAMMISERDGKLAKQAKQIKKYKVVEENLEKTKKELTTTKTSLSEAQQDVKRGVGPVIREKNDLQKELEKIEHKFKVSREKTHNLQSEKAALERVSKTTEMEMKRIQKEVEKLRKKQDAVDNRVKNEQDARKKVEKAKKELESTLESERNARSKENKAFEKEKKEIEAKFIKEKTEIEEQMKKVEKEKKEIEVKLEKEKAELASLESVKKDLESKLEAEKSHCAEEAKSAEEAQKKLESEIEMERSARAKAAAESVEAVQDLQNSLTTEKSERAKETAMLESVKKDLEAKLGTEKAERAREVSKHEEAAKAAHKSLAYEKLRHAEAASALEESKTRHERAMDMERRTHENNTVALREAAKTLQGNLATEKAERTKEAQIATHAINQLTGNLTAEKTEREKEAAMFREAIKAVETSLSSEKEGRAQDAAKAADTLQQVQSTLEKEREERTQEVHIFESAMKEMDRNLSQEKSLREQESQEAEQTLKQVQTLLEAEKSGRVEERKAHEENAVNAKNLIEQTRGKVVELEAHLQKTVSKLESVQSAADNLEKELTQKTSQLERTQQTLRDTQERLIACEEELQKEMEYSTTELDNAGKLIKTGKNLLEHLRINHENYKESMQKTVEALSEKYDAKEAETIKLAKTVDEARAKCEATELERVKLEKLAADTLDKCDAAEAQVEALQKAAAKAGDKHKQALAERSTNIMAGLGDKERKEYEKKVKKLALRVDQLLKEHNDAQREKVKQLETKVKIMERNEYLEGKLVDYERGEGVIAQYAEWISKLQKRKLVYERKLEGLHKLCKEGGLTREEELLSRLAEAEGKVTGIEKELEGMEKNKISQQSENDMLKKELHKYRQQLSKREADWTKSLGGTLNKERISLQTKYKLPHSPDKKEE